MPFPIRYDLEERKQVFARAASIARYDAKRRGGHYDGNLASCSSDQVVQVEQQDIEIGQRYAEEEMKKIQKFMDAYEASNGIHLLHKRFVFPELNEVLVEGHADAGIISIKDLFYQLGLSEEKLKEVYEFSDRFIGRFTEDANQRLVSILDKEVKFEGKPDYEAILEDFNKKNVSQRVQPREEREIKQEC